MSENLDDRELLDRYVEERSDEVFAQLVARHIHHVYSVALREVNDAHLAADLTQAAFILLARKAGQVKRQASLGGWLFQTIRYAARNARRAAFRRGRYEQEAGSMISPDSETETDSLWERLAPLLNDALASLAPRDRDVVMLRFFEKRSHEEIAVRLGVGEAVARKRLSRAVERLRFFFARRGVTVAGTSLLLVLGTHGVAAAPAGLAGMVAANALGKGATLSASVLALVHGAGQALAWAKAKTTAAILAVTLLFCGGIVLSDRSRFRVEDVQFSSRFLSRRLPGVHPTADGGTNLFVLTSQRRRWEVGGELVERLHRLFPQAVVHRMEVSDGQGNSFAAAIPRVALFEANGAKYQLWQVPLFPRRGTNLYLRFFELSEGGRERNVGGFTVPNPARGGANAELRAQPLPATGRQGDLVVTLERVEVGRLRTGLDAPVLQGGFDMPMTCFTATLRQEGLSPAPWVLDAVRIADGTGNRWRAEFPAMRRLAGPEARFQAALEGALWPGEPAWQFDLEFLRADGFAATDVLSVGNLPVPGVDQVLELKQQHALGGHALHLLSLLGAEAYPAERGYVRVRMNDRGKSEEERVGLPPGGYLKLLVESRGADAGERISLMAATDESGRAVTIERGGSSPAGNLNYLLAAGPDARSLTLKFVRQERRSVSFVAHPTFVEAGNGR